MAMTNREFADRFIAKNGDWRNGNGTMFSRDYIAFSYGEHFPMAAKTTRFDADGKRILLVTSRDYSATTARHKSLIRNAAIDWRIIEVPHILAGNSVDRKTNISEHKANVQYLYSVRKYLGGQLDRARAERRKEMLASDIKKIGADIVEYRREFLR